MPTTIIIKIPRFQDFTLGNNDNLETYSIMRSKRARYRTAKDLNFISLWAAASQSFLIQHTHGVLRLTQYCNEYGIQSRLEPRLIDGKNGVTSWTFRVKINKTKKKKGKKKYVAKSYSALRRDRHVIRVSVIICCRLLSEGKSIYICHLKCLPYI